MHRPQPLLFSLRSVTITAFRPLKPYFSLQTFAHYSLGRMTSRGSGQNIPDRGRGRGRGRGRAVGYRSNVKDDDIRDSNCRISSNLPDEASIDDGSTNGRSQHVQTSPEREVNSSSKCTQTTIKIETNSSSNCTQSTVTVPVTDQQDQHILLQVGKDKSPNTVRTQKDCTSPNRAVGSSLRQPKSSSLVDSADDREWHDNSSGRFRSSQTLRKSQHQSHTPNLAPGNQRDRLYSRNIPSPAGKNRNETISSEKAADHHRTEHSELLTTVVPFDICQSKSVSPFALKPSLYATNKEKRKERQCSDGGEKHILRQGMVLLKKYISHSDQINIIKKCRELGCGPGGFYQPGYQDGAKLHLRMMCLGKNWDPETRSYGDRRLIDDVCPPSIPVEFKQLVEAAIQDSQAFLKQDSKLTNEEGVLPGMSPDVCIVNFYTENGRLGLHQDQDETPESLKKGLPVVSFSIGDSAEFLYGDTRDIEMAKKVVLESGDVLIFGGDSRHVYHGVPCIKHKSAPSFLYEEANLRPGRLNLTFRKY